MAEPLTRPKSSHTKRLSLEFAKANLKGKLKCAVQVPEALGKDVGTVVRRGFVAVTPRRKSSGDSSGGYSALSSPKAENNAEEMATPDTPKSLMAEALDQAAEAEEQKEAKKEKKETFGASVERPKVILVGSPWEDDIFESK